MLLEVAKPVCLGVIRGKWAREETKEEKEAWNLSRKSVLMYCGSTVGTVAVDDPAIGERRLYTFFCSNCSPCSYHRGGLWQTLLWKLGNFNERSKKRACEIQFL
ncbi:hypothetical protein HPP92_016648 [Vanilla planifolia]|uniref:Uncharacterized protein n=1 Tax=Vanilla planifolia TaxID=51239 RepID=A0A835US99_VANPL|nr:hypothetical protein HPP92_016648 [Vanilla planifolia]